MSALRLRQSSHYLAHLKEPLKPQAAPAVPAQTHTPPPPPTPAVAQPATLEQGANVSPSPIVRARGVGGEGDDKGQDYGGEAHMWQDGGPGVLVNVAHPPVDVPVDEGEEDEQGDHDKQAGKKGATATGTSFVGTRMLQKKKDAEAAAKKALEGQAVREREREREREKASFIGDIHNGGSRASPAHGLGINTH